MPNNFWEDPNHDNRKTRLRSIGEGRELRKLQRRERVREQRNLQTVSAEEVV
jgi:hypothetical protein